MAGQVKLIVGLGNPGGDYKLTRHNAGFWFLDEVAQRFGCVFRKESKFFGDVCKVVIDGTDCWLIKPSTFMNKSGQAVAAISAYYKVAVEDTIVVHDEIDLEPGQLRLKKGGGHAGHNGLRDIISAIGGRDFLRIRLGVGHPGDKSRVAGFVLGQPSKTEQEKIDDAVYRGLKEFEELVCGDVNKAMKALNTG